jgi:hypothetical protein
MQGEDIVQMRLASLVLLFGICPLLGYYAASCSNCLTTFRDNMGPIFTGQFGTDTLSRNVGKQLPHPRRAQISSTSLRKPEIKVLLFIHCV